MIEARAMDPDTEPEAFARGLLEAHGLPSRPLEATGGWSNRVWLAPGHVVRLSQGRFRDAFAHEARVLRLLPPDVPHAGVVAHGAVGRREWLVLERVPGRPLGDVWKALSEGRRQSAIAQLGELLRALHNVRLPTGFDNPWLHDAFAPGGDLRDAYHAPPHLYRRLIDAAWRVPGVDRAMLEQVDAFIGSRLGAFGDEPTALVHSDVHFANLLWDGDRIGALLDFEGSRPAAPDLELDTLLRFCREPEHYPMIPGETSSLTAHDLASVTQWLSGAYPALFAHPRLSERLAVYEALWHLTQLLHFPPGSGPPDPWGHLLRSVEGGHQPVQQAAAQDQRFFAAE